MLISGFCFYHRIQHKSDLAGRVMPAGWPGKPPDAGWPHGRLAGQRCVGVGMPLPQGEEGEISWTSLSTLLAAGDDKDPPWAHGRLLAFIHSRKQGCSFWLPF